MERRLGKLSFSFFNKEILGCKDLVDVHEQLMERAQYGSKRQLTLIPRGHLKSTILTIGYSVWRIVKNPNIRICISNAKQDNAETFLTEIRGHFEGNQKLRALYGDFVGKKWNEGEFVVSTRTKVLKEPTCKAVGVGASVVSQHYDLVIADDLVNETNITTIDQITKVKDWWRLAASLGDGDQTDWRIIGTRYHYDDLYGYIIAEQADRYDIYIRKALENGKPIYPSKFNAAHLEEIRREQGSYIYSCQYNNEPIDDESAIFQKNWLRFYKDDDLKRLGKLNIFVTCDPAISEEASADETVFIVNGVDRFNNWWILDIIAGRMNSRKLIEHIFDIDDRWRPKTFGVETQSFQKIIKYQLEDEMKAKNWWIPFTELKPDLRSKKSRIRGLQPRFEYGIIYLKENAKDTEKFVDQYLRFPKSLHDDYLDALAYQLDVAYPPKVETERRKKKRYLNPITRY